MLQHVGRTFASSKCAQNSLCHREGKVGSCLKTIMCTLVVCSSYTMARRKRAALMKLQDGYLKKVIVI